MEIIIALILFFGFLIIFIVSSIISISYFINKRKEKELKEKREKKFEEMTKEEKKQWLIKHGAYIGEPYDDDYSDDPPELRHPSAWFGYNIDD